MQDHNTRRSGWSAKYRSTRLGTVLIRVARRVRPDPLACTLTPRCIRLQFANN